SRWSWNSNCCMRQLPVRSHRSARPFPRASSSGPLLFRIDRFHPLDRPTELPFPTKSYVFAHHFELFHGFRVEVLLEHDETPAVLEFDDIARRCPQVDDVGHTP